MRLGLDNTVSLECRVSLGLGGNMLQRGFHLGRRAVGTPCRGLNRGVT